MEPLDIQHVFDRSKRQAYCKDACGVYTWCNQAWLELYGFHDSEAVLGKTDSDLGIANHSEIGQALQSSGDSSTHEETIQTPSGARLITHCRDAIRDNAGNIIGVFGFYSDVRGGGDLRKDIEASNVDLKNIIKSLPGNVYWLDKNNVYRGCNELQAKSAGFKTPQEMIGKTNYDLPWKDDADAINALNKKVMETGEPFEEEEFCKSLEGENVVYLSKKMPLYSKDNNEVIGVLGISFDITGKKKKERELIKAKGEAEIALKNVIARLPGNVYWVDRNNVYRGCNEQHAKFAGLEKPEDIVGKRNSDMPWGHAAASLDALNEKVMATGEEHEEEEAGDFFDGKKSVFLSRKTPLYGLNNEIVGMLGLSFDITDKKKAEWDLLAAKKKAEIASEAKSEFIANMSHDLRTPMTGVMGMLQELTHLESDIEQVLGNSSEAFSKLAPVIQQANTSVSIAKESTDILLCMFNEILETVRADSGKANNQEEAFDVGGVLRKQVALLQPTAKEKKLTLSSQLDPSVPQALLGSRTLLDRILMNLIGNALKFTETGSVTISVRRDESDSEHAENKVMLEFCVADTGIGIPEDKFEEIFQHFSRLTPSYRGVYAGFGLGLHAVKGYVSSMGGTIRVESTLGEGSRFFVRLPFSLYEGEVSEEVVPSEEVFVPPKGDVVAVVEPEILKSGATSVLVVEDNLAAARAVCSILKRLGCESDHADCGKEAIAKVSGGSYGLILMDVGLPDITGLDATKAIRALTDTTQSQVPIVALTGHVDKRDVCLAAGMQDLLKKPTNEPDIRRVLETYLHVSDQRPVIDWEASLPILGDQELLEAVVAKAVMDLQDKRPEFVAAYEVKDWEAIKQLLIHVKGGICYFEAPALMESVTDYLECVDAECQAEQLNVYHKKLLKNVDTFIKEVSS